MGTNGRHPLLSHPIAVGVALIVLYGVLRSLAAASGLLLICFFSILLATLFTYPIDFLSRFMRRGFALLITLAVVVGGVVGTAFIAAPAMANQAARIAQQLPAALDRLATFWYGADIARTPQGAQIATTVQHRLTAELGGLVGKLVPAALSVLSSLGITVVLIALAFFFALAPDRYRDGIRTLVPRAYEPMVDEAWRRLGVVLKHWLGGIFIAMAMMGTLTAVGLWIAGIESWAALGLLTFFGTFVPYVGALASAIPGLAAGLAASPQKLLYAAIVYLAVHLVEGYLVEPLIMRRAVELRPATLLFWQLLMGTLFGLPGVIVATPLLVCVKAALSYFYVEQYLGKRGPGDPRPPRAG